MPPETPAAEEAAPDLPPSRVLSSSLALMTRLRAATAPWRGQPLVGEAWYRWFEQVREVVPSSVSLRALQGSLLAEAGSVWTPQARDQVCWRLAGNLDRLRRGEPVPRWQSQKAPEWCAAQITGLAPARAWGRSVWRPSLVLMTGSPAGLRAESDWRNGFCYYLGRLLGYQRFSGGDRPPARQMQHPSELVQLRLWVLVEPRRSDGVPGFRQVNVSGPLRQWNHQVMDLRDRLKPGYTCPADLPPTAACFRCVRGYRSCPAATHRSDYYFAGCPACGQLEQAFDPDVSDEKCLQCLQSEARSPHDNGQTTSQ